MSLLRIVNLQREKCTGCGLCLLACSFEKEGRFVPRVSRIRILERDKEGFFPVICRNCEEAPCLDACPAGAMVRRKEDGYVILLEDKCVGCNMCIMVCPFNAIGRQGNRNYKCDTCTHLEKCAQICSHKAIQFQDVKKVNTAKRKNLARHLTVKVGGKGRW